MATSFARQLYVVHCLNKAGKVMESFSKSLMSHEVDLFAARLIEDQPERMASDRIETVLCFQLVAVRARVLSTQAVDPLSYLAGVEHSDPRLISDSGRSEPEAAPPVAVSNTAPALPPFLRKVQ